VTIDPVGQVAGSLASGQPFTTNIPVALDDRTLAGLLAAHHVQVTATAATPSSPLAALLGFLPLLRRPAVRRDPRCSPAGSEPGPGWAGRVP